MKTFDKKLYMKKYWKIIGKKVKSQYAKTHYKKHRKEIMSRVKKSQEKLGKEERKIRRRKYHLRDKFGMTISDYNLLLERQNGKCAICDKIPKLSLVIDHCHETGKIRGLLCQRCNMGLGYFQDNKILLEKATKYIKNHELQ
jgi:hypothetical protein